MRQFVDLKTDVVKRAAVVPNDDRSPANKSTFARGNQVLPLSETGPAKLFRESSQQLQTAVVHCWPFYSIPAEKSAAGNVRAV